MSDSLLKQGSGTEKGRSLVSLCAGALALCLLMVFGLLGLIAFKGMGLFWQPDLEAITLRVEGGEDRLVFGQVAERKLSLDQPDDEALAREYRIKVYRGNKKQYETGYFEWYEESRITSRSRPANLAFVEREEGGALIGVLSEIVRDEADGTRTVLAADETTAWERLEELREAKRAESEAAEDLARGELRQLNFRAQRAAYAKRAEELKEAPDPGEIARIEAERAQLVAEANVLEERYVEERMASRTDRAVFLTAEGEPVEVVLADLIHAIRPNEMGVFAKLGLYVQRAWSWVSENPRESNTEGGVFPQIFGTVMMVMLMSLFVVPLGVLAALYLREYAKQGPVVRIVRIAVNNLAGTPSIVFGVFGWGFFVLFLGGEIDAIFFPERLPEPVFGTGGILWASLTLALLTLPVVIVASEEGLAAVPSDVRAGSLALGATKWETLKRVVIPASSPAILTGAILAMARAAGEVAPLMVVGLQKSADALPFDATAPYVHLDRKFMHLGFHIYDLGFQSPDVDLVRPQIFTTALLLVGLVTAINLVAIIVRSRLREKYASSHV